MCRFTKELFKFLVFLTVFEKLVTLNFSNNFPNITEMSIYLQHFNNEIFSKKASRLTVVQSVKNRKAKYFLNELLDEYSKNSNYFKLLIKDVSPSYNNSFDYVNVMLIDSYESFEKIDAGPTTTTEDFSEYYVIVYYSLDENPENDIQKIFNYCWQFYTVNVVLLLKTEDETATKLYTYYPFTQNSCNNAQVHTIQHKSFLELNASAIFPDKFKTFYNCTLTAALWNVPPYLILPEPGSGTKEMEGFEGYLVNVLSQALEFQIDYIVPPNNDQRGLVKSNGGLTGALKMLKDRSADFSLGSFRCTLQRSTILSPSLTFYQTMQVFTVLALHQPCSSFENIAFPFQFHIWIVLMLLFFLLLISPCILKFYFPKALKFIYGFSSIYFINTNTLAIILNQNTKIVPKRNFARFTFVMWVLLTMILRSIYQGALYNFLTTQKSKAPPNSVADLIKHKYTLIVNAATNDTFSSVPVIRDKLINVAVMYNTDDGGFPLLEANPDKHYVTGTPKDFLSYFVTTHNKHGVFHVLKETVFAQHLCIYFTKHSCLVKAFNKVLVRLQNFGLINYWARLLKGGRYMERVNEASIKTPLTLAQLSAVFQICLGLYFLAIIIFICEIIWFKFK